MLKDQLNRSFTTLRISVTSNCNFSCHYCVNPEENLKLKRSNSLNAEDFTKLVEAIHRTNPIEIVRITGGEPSLYNELVPLVRNLKELKIPKIKITSNGSNLTHQLVELKEAGLHSINFSLDAIHDSIFNKITPKGNLNKVIACIKAANNLHIPFKINSTIMKGYNDKEILPLLQFANEVHAPIRFLELMKMGHLHQQFHQYFFSQEDILKLIQTQYKFDELPREASSTSRYWITDNNIKFGIIANSSSPFCQDCNRLRLSENGELFGCLSVNKGFSILDILNEKEINLNKILYDALAQKQTHQFSGSSLSMKNIGG